MADTEQLDEDKRCTLFAGPKKFCQRCMEFHSEAEWSDGCERYLGGQPIRNCKTCGGWHPLDMWGRNCMPEPNWNESDLPVCRNFISDNLEGIGGLNGLQCQVSGKFFTSKKLMRDEYRARGVIETGNDAKRLEPVKKPKPDRRAIKESVARAINAVENGARVENYVKQRKNAGAFGRVAANT